MTWKRARKSEQKEQRRRMILEAACKLFTESGFDATTLNDIARKAGISKPSLYTYFATREEIFLTLFGEAQTEFLNDLVRRLKRIRSKDTPAQISRVWVEVALANRTFLNLMPLVMTAMERNSSADQILEFSRSGLILMEELVQVLHGVDARLSNEQWTVFVRCAVSMMVGLWTFTEPAGNVRNALDHLDMHAKWWEFAPMMRQGLTAMIVGIREQGTNKNRG